MAGITEPPAKTGLELIDRALRALGSKLDTRHPLPPLVMVRNLTDVLELVFAGPVDRTPPDGVIAVDGTTWAVPALDGLDNPVQERAPYNGLSAIGTGCYGSMVLLNLAALRPFVVTSTGEYAAQVLRAVSLDLARSPMAENVRVHLVGFGSQLAAARPDRINYFEHLGLAVASIAEECWTENKNHNTSASGRGPGGLHVLICVHPAERNNHGLADLLRTYPNVTAVLAETHTSKDLPPGAHLDCDRSRLYVGDASWMLTPRRVAVEEYAAAVARVPSAPGHPGRASGRPVPIGDETPRLEIRLLGAPELAGIDTSQADPRKLNQTIQIACYLALNPGATATQIGRVLTPEARDPLGEIHSRISRARNILGETHLPKAEHHHYRLHGVRIDSEEFYRMVNRAKARTPINAASDLEQALALVRGRPLDDDGYNRYSWAIAEAEALLRDILDTSHHLVQLYLETHRPRAAWHAARKALTLDELHPIATQDLFRALDALGETDQLYRARDHYQKTCARRGLPVDKATLDLAHQLLHPGR